MASEDSAKKIIGKAFTDGVPEGSLSGLPEFGTAASSHIVYEGTGPTGGPSCVTQFDRFNSSPTEQARMNSNDKSSVWHIESRMPDAFISANVSRLPGGEAIGVTSYCTDQSTTDFAKKYANIADEKQSYSLVAELRISLRNRANQYRFPPELTHDDVQLIADEGLLKMINQYRHSTRELVSAGGAARKFLTILTSF